MTLMVKEWTLFLDRCIEHRIRPDLFDTATAQLHAKSPLPGRKIAALLLRPRTANASSVDPRLIIYLERLLVLKKVDASDVLASAFQYSKDRLPKTGTNESPKDVEWHNPPELEEVVFHRLSKSFQAEERPLNNTEGLRTLVVVTRWMQVMVTSHTSDTMIQAMAGIQQQPQQQSINVREGLGMLVVGVVENPKMLHILNNPKGKGRRGCFPMREQSSLLTRSPRPPQKLRTVVVFIYFLFIPKLNRLAKFFADCQPSRDFPKAT
jgi:mediator of RNA polymerase II transcription subunit 5